MVQSEISTHGTWKHFNSEYLSPIIIFFTTIQINQTIAHPFEKNIFEIESKPMPMRMYAAESFWLRCWVFHFAGRVNGRSRSPAIKQRGRWRTEDPFFPDTPRKTGIKKGFNALSTTWLTIIWAGACFFISALHIRLYRLQESSLMAVVIFWRKFSSWSE